MAGKKVFYLTKEGLEKIKKEYTVLQKARLAKTIGEVPKIWESEDLNPEYLSFQQDLNFIETRLSELEDVLKNAEIIKIPLKSERGTIILGSKVLLDIDGNKDEFTIVGTMEANPSLGRISNESPVGRALLGHKVGDQIIVSSPIKTTYKIKKIKYS